MLTIKEFTRGNDGKSRGWKISLRSFCASILLCCCLVKPLMAGNNYNDNFNATPFAEMMTAMIKVMSHMMGNNNYVPGLGALPYSPGMAMMPGLTSGLGGMNSLPMSPANSLPMNNFMNSNQANFLPDNFPAGQNAQSFNTMNDFWNPKLSNQNSNSFSNSMSNNKYEANSVNGIWQSLSGDVIAIYKNSHFMWTDGKTRRLSGRLFIKGNRLVAYFPISKKKLHFQFYKESGQFIVKDQTSRIYTFKRLH